MPDGLTNRNWKIKQYSGRPETATIVFCIQKKSSLEFTFVWYRCWCFVEFLSVPLILGSPLSRENLSFQTTNGWTKELTLVTLVTSTHPSTPLLLHPQEMFSCFKLLEVSSQNSLISDLYSTPRWRIPTLRGSFQVKINFPRIYDFECTCVRVDLWYQYQYWQYDKERHGLQQIEALKKFHFYSCLFLSLVAKFQPRSKWQPIFHVRVLEDKLDVILWRAKTFCLPPRERYTRKNIMTLKRNDLFLILTSPTNWRTQAAHWALFAAPECSF